MPTKTRFAALLGAAAVLVASVAFATPASATPTEIDYWSSSCPTSLTYGENDGCVAYLQDLLNTFGFGLSVDGQFGSHTLSAVEWVQTKAHLHNSSVSVDGQVGPVTKTWIDNFYHNTSYQTGPSTACAIDLATNPNYAPYNGSASATVAQSNDAATCTGWLERSDNGGASWYAVSGRHTPGGPGQWASTGLYSDDPTQLTRACVYYVGSGTSGTDCTIGF